jgi:hypothetical protein
MNRRDGISDPLRGGMWRDYGAMAGTQAVAGMLP